jgi:hypothetical protein
LFGHVENPFGLTGPIANWEGEVAAGRPLFRGAPAAAARPHAMAIEPGNEVVDLVHDPAADPGERRSIGSVDGVGKVRRGQRGETRRLWPIEIARGLYGGGRHTGQGDSALSRDHPQKDRKTRYLENRSESTAYLLNRQFVKLPNLQKCVKFAPTAIPSA